MHNCLRLKSSICIWEALVIKLAQIVLSFINDIFTIQSRSANVGNQYSGFPMIEMVSLL